MKEGRKSEREIECVFKGTRERERERERERMRVGKRVWSWMNCTKLRKKGWQSKILKYIIAFCNAAVIITNACLVVGYVGLCSVVVCFQNSI